MITITPLSRRPHLALQNRSTSSIPPYPWTILPLPHTVKGSWPLHLALHFKPRALSGQAYQLPAWLIALRLGLFHSGDLFGKTLLRSLLITSRPTASVVPIRRVMPTPCRFLCKPALPCQLSSKPRSSRTVPLCLLKPWVHPCSPGAHGAPLCPHPPLCRNCPLPVASRRTVPSSCSSLRLKLEAPFLCCEAPRPEPSLGV